MKTDKGDNGAISDSGRKRSTVIIIVIVALLVIGVGGGLFALRSSGSSGTEKKLADTANTFLIAVNNGDCTTLKKVVPSTQWNQAFATAPCEQMLTPSGTPLAEDYTFGLEVLGSEITSDTAIIAVKSTPQDQTTSTYYYIAFEKENGTWRVSDFSTPWSNTPSQTGTGTGTDTGTGTGASTAPVTP